MVAYAVFIRERLRDADAMQAYRERVGATLEGHPVTRRVSYGALEVLEGPASEGMVILEFPNMAAARAWYEGPEYREARTHRFLAADYRAFIVEGV